MANSDFFLGDDDAKTYGDIDYMRKVKRVRKTFAKPAYDELAIATETNDGHSALTKESSSSTSKPTTSTTSEVQPAASASTSSSTSSVSDQRRRSDTNLDMFRNMARGMKKSR